MTRNSIYLLTTIVAIVTLVLSYQLYQERHKTSSIEINVGGRSISIEKR
jgi:hypothetical protein